MAKAKSKTPRPATSHDGFLFAASSRTRDLLSLGLLYVVALLLFRGIIFSNAAFSASGDTAAALSYAHAGDAIHQAEGVDVLWMPNFFSGMPTFGNVAYVPHNVNYLQTAVTAVLNFLFLNGAWTWYVVFYFLGGVFMYLLMRTWRFGSVASLIAALTFMLSPFAIGLAGEGHGSKLMALSYLPLTVLLLHLLLEKRSLLTFGLLSAALGTLFLTNHMQIVYYVLLIAGGYLLLHIFQIAKEHPRRIPVVLGLFAGALLVGFCISSYIYLSVYEYAQFSIRGGGTAGSTTGLNYSYATNWSWSLREAVVLLIPGFYGINGTTAPPYWGSVEPWTTSTIYVGLLPVILAVIALAARRTALAWFAAIGAVLVILISCGRNFPLVYDLMFSYLPFFNKFRAPSMILQVLPFLFGILGAIGYSAVEESVGKGRSQESLTRTLTIAAAIFAGILLLSFLGKGVLQDTLSGSFVKDNEPSVWRQQYGQQAAQAATFYRNQRWEIFWKDYIKFLLLGTAMTGALALYVRKKLGATTLASALLVLLSIDMFLVDDRLITPEPRSAAEESFLPNNTIAFLKQQPGDFRIFPVGQDEFSDNTFAYHGLQTIGGYSPAKLKIYQTMLDSVLFHGADPNFPLNMAAVNMLNVRYLVAKGRLPEDRFELVNVDQAQRTLTYRNPGALPRAWFVDSVINVRTDTEVFATLNARGFDPKRVAIVQGTEPVAGIGRSDSTASVTVTSRKSRSIVMKTRSSVPALLVVSEVYYPAGWKAAVDGQETPIYRTNSILRSVTVPAGEHEVTMTFDPPMYQAGYLLSNAGWIVAVLSILAGGLLDPAVRGRILRRKSATGNATPTAS